MEGNSLPTYEYECEDCEVVFEKFQSMTDPRLQECPECGGRVKRLIGTGAGVLFKGSGFYQTDYRSDSYKSAAKRDQAKESPSTTSSASSSTSSADSPKSSDTKKKNDS